MYNVSRDFLSKITGLLEIGLLSKNIRTAIAENIPNNFGLLKMDVDLGRSIGSIFSDIAYYSRHLYSCLNYTKYQNIDTLVIFLPSFNFGSAFSERKSTHVPRYKYLGKSDVIYIRESQEFSEDDFKLEYSFYSQKEEDNQNFLGGVYSANVQKVEDNMSDTLTENSRIKNIYLITSSYVKDYDPVTNAKAFHILISGLEKVIGKKLPFTLANSVRDFRKMGVTKYSKFLTSKYKQMESNIVSEMDNLKSQLNNFSRKLVPISHFTRKPEVVLNKIQEELENASKIKGVERVYLDKEGSFYFSTEYIYIKQPPRPTALEIDTLYEEDEDGEEHERVISADIGGENLYWDIGKLNVKVDTKGKVYFTNLTRTVEGYTEKASHPHAIKDNGYICLGEIDSVITELIMTYEYSALAGILFNFAKSVNLQDVAGKSVVKWPVIELKHS